MTELEKRVREEAEKVVNPETGLTFGQVKMITDLKEEEPAVVKIDFVPSSPSARLPSSLPWTLRRQQKAMRESKRC